MHRPIKRFRIEYFDRGESLAPYLPRNGTRIGEHFSLGGVGPWLLLALDEAFEYQVESRRPLSWRLMRVDAFLVRSRWAGEPIGGVAGVSVFICLVEQGKRPITPGIDVEAYTHGAWGLCKPVSNR
jgi:hypothetical protein